MPVSLTDTTLGQFNRSWPAARLESADMAAVIGLLDKTGFSALEICDIFDLTYLAFLGVDPWQRLTSLCQSVKVTQLQVSLRYPPAERSNFQSAQIQETLRRLSSLGIARVLVYDPANDREKLQALLDTVRECGLQSEAGLCPDAGSLAALPGLAKSLAESGCDSLCILDLARRILPASAAELVEHLRAVTRLPLNLRIPDPGGMACMSYYAAACAGVSGLDTACAPFGCDSSAPAAETIIAGLGGTAFAANLHESAAAQARLGIAALLEKRRPDPSADSPGPRPAAPLYTLTEDLLRRLLSPPAGPQSAPQPPNPPAKPAGDVPREYSVELDGEVFNLKIGPPAKPEAEIEKPTRPPEEVRGGVASPMPGVVLSVNVKVGDPVHEGDLLATVEAMKMRYDVYASEGGTVKAVLVSEGDTVTTETVLLVLD